MKTLDKIKDFSWAITVLLLMMVLFRQCGINRDIERINKVTKAIEQKVDSIPTGDQIEHKMNKVMFDFLIYEDLDHQKFPE